MTAFLSFWAAWYLLWLMRPCSKALALPGLGVVRLTSQTLSGFACDQPTEVISITAVAITHLFKRIALFSCPDMGANEWGPGTSAFQLWVRICSALTD